MDSIARDYVAGGYYAFVLVFRDDDLGWPIRIFARTQDDAMRSEKFTRYVISQQDECGPLEKIYTVGSCGNSGAEVQDLIEELSKAEAIITSKRTKEWEERNAK